ncbi:hypothetical protein L195_g039361, partial [Trifolium pratense]
MSSSPACRVVVISSKVSCIVFEIALPPKISGSLLALLILTSLTPLTPSLGSNM